MGSTRSWGDSIYHRRILLLPTIQQIRLIRRGTIQPNTQRRQIWTINPPSIYIIPLAASISGKSYSGNYPCVVNNGYAILTCNVTGGNPPYSYQWYEDGTLITGATSQSYTTTHYSNATHTFYCHVIDSKGATANTETDTVSWRAQCPAI